MTRATPVALVLVLGLAVSVGVAAGPSFEEYAIFGAVLNHLSSQQLEGDIRSASISRKTMTPEEADPSWIVERCSADTELTTLSLRIQGISTKRPSYFLLAPRSDANLPLSEWGFIESLANLVAGLEPASFLSAEVAFSRAAISPDGTRAVVYAEFRCPLCGFGGYFGLSRPGEQWEVTEQCIYWVS